MWAAAFFFSKSKIKKKEPPPPLPLLTHAGSQVIPASLYSLCRLFYITLGLNFSACVYISVIRRALHTHTQIHRHVHTDREKAPSRAACCGCCRSWLRFAVALEPASQSASQPACCGAVEQREAASRAARARRGRGLSLDSITGQSMFHTRNTHKATAIGR